MKGFWFLAASLVALPLVAEEKAGGKTADKVKSGCQPGEGLRPFKVVDVTGRFKKDASVCYI